MSKSEHSPTPLKITKSYARRFLLSHQYLWPPRRLKGNKGITDFIQHVGCIQYDPINVVGRNPDLVLQSRVKDYHPDKLEGLLYTDRLLLDGWDKVQSIYTTTDWPYFSRYRTSMRVRRSYPLPPEETVLAVLDAIRERGPLSSLDMKTMEKIDWHWGKPVPMEKATLETLYATGEISIHHKVNTRRIFDLSERLLPPDVMAAPDPNASDEEYQDWHILRRVGGIGLANPSASEFWLGIQGVNTKIRRVSIARLVEKGDLVPLEVEDIPNRFFYIRTTDLPALEIAQKAKAPKSKAAVIGALDNLTWDRDMLRWIFNFDYVWEVYKPVSKRKYGYYVLPVLYGDSFIARFDPSFDKKKRSFTINNWWWEDNIELSEKMRTALYECFQNFARYLGTDRIHLGGSILEDGTLAWLQDVN
jgi:uncharacterized protein YcaQ